VEADQQNLKILANGTYKVITVNTQGCEYVSQPYVVDIDGLPTVQRFSDGNTVNFGQLFTIELWPNPVDQGVLQLSSNRGLGTITIYNSFGQLVLKKHLNEENASLDVSQLIPGPYIITNTFDSVFQQSLFIVR
jgi:hypothetical protein